MSFMRCRTFAAALVLAGATAGLGQAASANPLNWFTPGYFVHASEAEIGAPSWTGFIVDPDFGFDTLNLSGPGARLLDDPEGMRLGGEIGYDLQMGNFVAGIVGDAFYTWIDGDGRGAGRGLLDADMDYMGTVRGRLGLAFGRFMAYGTGGFAFGDLEITNAAGLSDDASLSGWAAGGGLEYMWNRNFSVRFEYIRVDFGDERFSSLPAGADRIEADMDLFNFGLITRF